MVVFLQMMLVISCQIHGTIAIPLHIVNWHAVTLLSFEIHFTRQKPLRVVTINPRNIVKYNSFAPFVIVSSILILTSKLKCFLETWQWWCNKLSPNKWNSGRDSLIFPLSEPPDKPSGVTISVASEDSLLVRFIEPLNEKVIVSKYKSEYQFHMLYL